MKRISGLSLRDRLGRARFHTFVVDPPTMVIFGLAAVLISVRFLKSNRKFIWAACGIFQLIFWVAGPMMYLDVPFFAKQGTGNEFMWNGYLMGLKVVGPEHIPTYHDPVFNAIAIASWIIQPFCLYLGIRLGWRLVKRLGWKTD